MNEVEERLRREMAAAVQGVEAPVWLPAAARKGGRRRANRRRALLAAPATAAAVGAVGVASWGGWLRTGETSVVAPASSGALAPQPDVRTEAGPTAGPGGQEDLQEAARAAVAQAEALEAYFAAGYDYDDAVELGRLWNVEPGEAKSTAGAHLLAGEDLPFEPVEQPVEQPPAPADDRAPQREAFFAAGYTYDDAVELARAWNVDPWEAKALAGERLLAGETLPVQP
ncbi:hypothetical protein [Kineococcus sp. G2]|uniref:hypothetical protein n=1 Tax=Kineococcus sp. G2 TaxID=3127484 RepID=UPI00301B99E1